LFVFLFDIKVGGSVRDINVMPGAKMKYVEMLCETNPTALTFQGGNISAEGLVFLFCLKNYT
jgi:hypothetical protein